MQIVENSLGTGVGRQVSSSSPHMMEPEYKRLARLKGRLPIKSSFANSG